MQVAQRYAELVKLVPGCTGFASCDLKPRVRDGPGDCIRELSIAEAELRGATLSAPLIGIMGDGGTQILADLPIKFEDPPDCFWYMLHGKKVVVMSRLRFAHWLPLAPHGAMATPYGMLKHSPRQPASLTLRGEPVTAGWTDMDADVERRIERAARCEGGYRFDPYAAGTRRVITPDCSIKRLLFSAFRNTARVAEKNGGAWNAALCTSQIHRCMSTGLFPYNAQGVTQQMVRTSAIAQRAQQRMIVHCNSTHISTQARLVHASERGVLCPVMTPDGDKVGLTRSLAEGCVVSHATDADPWVAMAQDGADELRVNGVPVRDVCGDAFERAVRRARDTRDPNAPAVFRTPDGVTWLWCDCGRMMLTAADGRLYDVAEHYHRRTCGDVIMPEPTNIFSHVVAALPYANYSQQARSCFSAAQVMQHTATALHPSTVASVQRSLWYEQRPLVTTAASQQLHGLNVVLCITSYEGDNQEDALIVNAAAVDRGLFRTFTDRSCVNPHKGGVLDTSDGIPAPGLQRGPDDTSCAARYGAAQVHKSYVGVDMDNNPLTRVVDRYVHALSVGDKIASRHGQKGVVARVEPPENLPFDPATGGTVDVLFNAHGLPSRMSVGQVCECVAARLAAMDGRRQTVVMPWERHVLSQLQSALKSRGVASSGATRMIDGRSGQPIRAMLLTGLVFYMHQPHVAYEKCYCRGGVGAVHQVFRQPEDGRSRGGGLRLGEMEFAALKGYNVPEVMRQKSVIDCDPHVALLCDACGSMDVIQPERRCMRCNSTARLQEVRLPRAVQVFLNTQQALGVGTHLRTAPLDKDVAHGVEGCGVDLDADLDAPRRRCAAGAAPEPARHG